MHWTNHTQRERARTFGWAFFVGGATSLVLLGGAISMRRSTPASLAPNGEATLAAASLRSLHSGTHLPREALRPAAARSEGERSLRTWTSNGVDLHGLCASNPTALASLVDAPLNSASLVGSEMAELLRDNEAWRGIFSYLVECALATGDSLEVELPGEEPLVYSGSGGVAPEWFTQPCDDECQEWVSACLLARNNAYGIPVIIFLRGTHPELQKITPEEEALFSVEEAAFYGNIFQEPPLEYTCRGEGYDPWMLTARACALPGAYCGFQYVGKCRAQPDEPGACDPPVNGVYTRCYNRADRSDNPLKPVREYTRIVTVYLRPSGFAAGMDAGCASVPDWEGVGPAVPGSYGHPCASDADCIGECAQCDPRGPRGICTRACSPELEEQGESECGDSTFTCLRNGSQGTCTKACVPFEEDNCAPEQLCASNGLFLESPDSPGCVPFCASDADCPVGAYCNRRYGACGPPETNEGLEDGSPCEFPTDTAVFEIEPCRGACFRVSDDLRQGVCGSLLDLSRTTACYDRPDSMAPLSVDDEYGVCLFRRCKVDADCTAPLTCQSVGFGQKQCQWPSE